MYRSEFVLDLSYHMDRSRKISWEFRVMSICLCKKTEGAIFPLVVEGMEDGVDDAVDAEFVD